MASVEQFLTAVFELRPSRRKAAAMERIRATAEDVFWRVLEQHRPIAEAAIGMAREERRKAVDTIEAAGLRAAGTAGLAEAVAKGLGRDVAAAAASFIGLRSNDHPAEWPTRSMVREHDFDVALDACPTAYTKAEEDAARDELNRVARGPVLRPLTIARSRDGLIVRERENGPLVVLLNILKATDREARKTVIKAGIDAATGEVTRSQTSKTRLIVPLSCSKWHENKFLSGRAVLKSSQLFRRGERWFLAAQFAFSVPKVETIAALGVDRGIANLFTAAAIDLAGSVVATMPVAGNKVGETIRRAEQRAKAFQRRTGRSIPLHHRAAHHILHAVTNEIVAKAKTHRAQIVIERLDGLKSTITTKRSKGAWRSSWQKQLKKAQMGKVEQMLTYKAVLAGLPVPRQVMAGGTSVTCSCCGHRDSASRPAQDRFACIGCGFVAHADVNAAVQIARRGVMKVSKGDKLDVLHTNMVAGLRHRDDGGLGPLAAGVAKGFVAARAAADGANARLDLPTSPAGQNVTFDDENARQGVLAERVVVISEAPNEDFGSVSRHLPGGGSAEPSDVG